MPAFAMCVYIYIYINNTKELCESRGGRPGLPSPISLMVSVEVKQHDFFIFFLFFLVAFIMCRYSNNTVSRFFRFAP